MDLRKTFLLNPIQIMEIIVINIDSIKISPKSEPAMHNIITNIKQINGIKNLIDISPHLATTMCYNSDLYLLIAYSIEPSHYCNFKYLISPLSLYLL